MKQLTAALIVALGLAGCSQTSSITTTASIGTAEKPLPVGSKMELRGFAFPPPAFREFCAREPGLCSTSGATKVVKLTPRRLAELKAVNFAVNRRIQEQSDLASTGKKDDWRLPKNVGDCEDFAILKKRELMRKGWPASALLLTVATWGSTGHVVLTARTDKGDFVLDNLTSSVKDWSNTPYRYFARQSQTSQGKWERIGSGQSILVTG